MAALTLWAEPASVLVVFFMACCTGRREDDLLDHWHGVAVMTLQPFVSAVEFEVGTGIVIEVPDFPVACIVTILTTASQLPTMGVAALMTRVAVDGGFVLVQDAFMATMALRYTMLAEQRIFGVSIMLKGQGFPILLDMTTFAGFAEPVFMLVILLMAGITVGRCFVLVEHAGVARVTFRLPVIAFERVGGISIMLKGQGFPILLDMTAFAGCAEPVFMLVVLLMAGRAVAWRLVLVQMPFMTGGAFGRDMVSS